MQQCYENQTGHSACGRKDRRRFFYEDDRSSSNAESEMKAAVTVCPLQPS